MMEKASNWCLRNKFNGVHDAEDDVRNKLIDLALYICVERF